MNEISLQAIHFSPRLFAVIALLSLTGLLAIISQPMILRKAVKFNRDPYQGLSKAIANFAFGATLLIMSSFIFNAVGLNTVWIARMQNSLAQVFINSPIIQIASLFVAGIGFLVSGVPKFFVQLKGSPGAPQREIQSR